MAWLSVAASGALVLGGGFEPDRSGDGAVVVFAVVWSVAVLGCSASGGPEAFGLLPGLGATVGVAAAAVEADGGTGADVGRTEPAAALAPPGSDSAGRVDPAADGELGTPAGVVAGEAPESPVAVVASEAPGLGE